MDWRGALSREANKMRPAIVVDDGDLFDAAYRKDTLVPLADDPKLAMIKSMGVPVPRLGTQESCRGLRLYEATESLKELKLLTVSMVHAFVLAGEWRCLERAEPRPKDSNLTSAGGTLTLVEGSHLGELIVLFHDPPS